mgnify:CR=1 FL=1
MDHGSDNPDRIRSYRDLKAWQHSFRLALEVHRVTESFPRSERFGLSAQVRRSSVSVPANIAEGYGRGGRQDYVRFLKIARGSLYETDNHLLLSRELGFLPRDDNDAVKDVLDHAERTLAGLIRSLEPPNNTGDT